MFSRALTQTASSRAMAGESMSCAARSLRVTPVIRNRRIEMVAPSMASGGMMMLTRLPSGSLRSTIGLASSIRRPTQPEMRWAMRSRCWSSRNLMSTGSSLPWRST